LIYYTSKWILSCWAEEGRIAIKECFNETEHPRDLTIVPSTSVCNRKEKGMSHLVIKVLVNV
jgi:propionate CoA-transferase